MKKTQIAYGVIIIVLILFLEYLVDLNYITKQMVRIPFMVVVPYFLLKYSNSTILTDLKVSKLSFRDVRVSVIAGLVVYVGAIGGYALIYQITDPSSITEGLMGLGITASNIVYVSIYMTFINVIVEEFFFRGFVYMNLQKYNNVLAYLMSSFLFALFHLGIVSVYFEPLVFFGLMLGLMVVGAFLIYVNTLGKSLVNSYIVHAFADVAMFTIGLYLFLQ